MVNTLTLWTVSFVALLVGSASATLVCTAQPSSQTSWCNKNCNHVPPFCPSNICTCIKLTPAPTPTPAPGTCVALSSPATSAWCTASCFHVPPTCPANLCACNYATQTTATATATVIASPSASSSITATASASRSASTSPTASPIPKNCQAAPSTCTCADNPCSSGPYLTDDGSTYYYYFDPNFWGPYTGSQVRKTIGANFVETDATSNPNSGPFCEDIPNNAVPFTCRCRTGVLTRAAPGSPLLPSTFLGATFNSPLDWPQNPFSFVQWTDNGWSGYFCETEICFPSAAKVTTSAGVTKRMDELSLGDSIRCIDDDGSIINCIVHHYTTITTGGKYRSYYKLTTTRSSLFLSDVHNIFVTTDASFTSGPALPAGIYKNANTVQLNDKLVTFDPATASYTASAVIAIDSNGFEPGAYAPVLMTAGRKPIHRFIVDDFVVSTQVGRSCSGSEERTAACAYWDAFSFLTFSSSSPGYGQHVDNLPSAWGWSSDGNSPQIAQRQLISQQQRNAGFRLDSLKMKAGIVSAINGLASGQGLTFEAVFDIYKGSFVSGSKADQDDMKNARFLD